MIGRSLLMATLGLASAAALPMSCEGQAAAHVLGQYAGEDPSEPRFRQLGPNGGPSGHGFRFWARGVGRVDFSYRGTEGIAVDTVGRRLFVPDSHNHRVLVFALDAGGLPAARDAVQVLGQPGPSSTVDDNRARPDLEPAPPSPTAANLLQPAAAVYDHRDRTLFVADARRNRVLAFDATRTGDGVPAGRVLGQPSPTTPESRRTGPSTLSDPRGLAVDERRRLLWVADTRNHRVLAFRLDGQGDGPAAIHVLGQEDFVSGLPNRGGTRPGRGTLSGPVGLALSRDGRLLYVADEGNNRVLAYDLRRGPRNGMAAARVLGQPGFAAAEPNRGRAEMTPSTLYRPRGLAVEPGSGRLVVADSRNHRLLLFRPGSRRPESVIGMAAFTGAVPDGLPPAARSTMNWPTGVATFRDRLYVVDGQNNRVLVFDVESERAGREAVAVLGQYVEGAADRPSFTQQGANDGPTSFEFDHSDGVSGAAVSTDGQWLGVADALNGRVLLFALGPGGVPEVRARYALGVRDFATIGGHPTSRWRIRRPQRLLFDDRDRLFVADDQGNRVLGYDLVNGIRTGLSAQWVLGQPGFETAERRRGRGGLNRPRGLGYDPGREWLFVADTDNHRVLVFDLGDGLHPGMPAAHVLGQPDFEAVTENRGGPPGPGGLSYPRDPVYDPERALLFVADTGNRRVLVFDLSTGIRDGMPAVGVLGQPSFSASDPGTGASRVTSVGSVALDTDRDLLYVGDRRGWRTVVFDLDRPIGIGAAARAVLGQIDFEAHAPPPGRRFGIGGNLAVDPSSGTLYAVDPTNTEHRVLVVPHRFAPTQSLPTGEIGEAYHALLGAGGVGPMRFRVTHGALPEGITLEAATGRLAGQPEAGAAGDHRFEVEVVDGLGRSSTHRCTVRIGR